MFQKSCICNEFIILIFKWKMLLILIAAYVEQTAAESY